MRLTELDAEFIGEAEPRSFRRLESPHGAQGILFQCPKCAEGKERAHDGGFIGVHSVMVWFKNPIGGVAPAPSECTPTPRWERTGETIDTLSLYPSIDCTPGGGCKWHGSVAKGEAS